MRIVEVLQETYSCSAILANSKENCHHSHWKRLTSSDIMRATLIAKGTDITVLWATGLGSLDIADMVVAASAKGAACSMAKLCGVLYKTGCKHRKGTTGCATCRAARAQHVHAPWMRCDGQPRGHASNRHLCTCAAQFLETCEQSELMTIDDN